MAEHNAYWQKKLSSYSETQWAKGPNLFAETAEQYFPRHARVLEIGSGVGQDGRWFASNGHSVLQTDLGDFGFFVKEDKGLTWHKLDLL